MRSEAEDKGLLIPCLSWWAFILIFIASIVFLIMIARAVDASCRRFQHDAEARRERKLREVERAAREAEQAEAEAKAAAPMIPFTVKELTGKAVEVATLSALHTVAELKSTVAAATGGDVELLRLVFKNVPLEEDYRTLGSYGVGAGAEVTAVAKAAAQEALVPPAP